MINNSYACVTSANDFCTLQEHIAFVNDPLFSSCVRLGVIKKIELYIDAVLIQLNTSSSPQVIHDLSYATFY